MYTHIEDNIYTIPVPLPNNPLRQLNSYVIKGEGRNLVIDTGFKLEECRKALCDGLEELGVDMNCTDIFLTHLHSDHSGLAAELATQSSKIYISRADGELLTLSLTQALGRGGGVPQLRLLRERTGELLGEPLYEIPPGVALQLHLRRRRRRADLRGRRLEVIFTPGHTPATSACMTARTR